MAAKADPPAADSQAVDLDSASLYCNRELSLLLFQHRVLDEAKDPANPLLERVNFLSIVSSNLDEFFMVRVAVLKQQIASGAVDPGGDGRSGGEQLDAIATAVSTLVDEAYACLRKQLV